ncbi:hypothetical protein FQA39_LY01113 [Lamprigera yunnana]|nr:hypothetical protein FQA39_LY01113 [Lamprigera yunnana]
MMNWCTLGSYQVALQCRCVNSRDPWKGYENQDWFIPSPALKVEEADLKLSPDQIRETLNYFLLCSNRVSQMTKTYDDIEAVTRLLEEKEKDLELTARIGKELLQQNNKFELTIASLGGELKTANEKITQLLHESAKKTELIQILTNDMDESFFENGVGNGRINLDLMQKKISTLEEENVALKTEYCQLAAQTDDVEAKEQMLLSDITGQLACANSSMGFLEDEMDRQKEENRIQHEHILIITAKLKDTEMKLHKIATENEEANSLLQITKETQNSLALELADLKEKYIEVEGLLRDAQEQLRKARRRTMPTARSSFFPSLGSNTQVPFDSLQNELELSMHSEFSTDSGFSAVDSINPYYKKVFDTVRCASRSSLSSGDSVHSLNVGVGGHVTSNTSGPRMSSRTQNYRLRRSTGSIYSSSSLGYPSLDSTGQSDTESSQTDSEDGYPGPPRQGIPGAPGAAELEAALRRLSPGEVLARRTNLQYGPTYSGYESDCYLPYGCRTPDSLMSTGSGGYPGWKLPEKLQIVKPLEGSQTLHHWSQLAQPTFNGLLEERPGVKIRGGKELEDMGLESYALSDLEEDDEYSNPGKMFDSSTPIYTLTNSTVMHPDDGTFVVTSVRASCVPSVCSSIQNSPPQTPDIRSRRNSTSTFSTTYGLARMLNERGIKAVTPSAFNTPCGINSFTPTATPCNSPDGTPPLSRSTSPEPYEAFSIPQLIRSSVPQFLQQTVVGGTKRKMDLKRKDKFLKSESLITKIERMGISNLMGSPSALTISAGMYARPALTSPMAQLTCLLPHQNSEDHLQKRTKKLEEEPLAQSPPTAEPNGLGVPGKPGSDALNRRLQQLNSRKQRRNGATRPDLGTVSTKKLPDPEQTSTLGTLSSLLFGRKGATVHKFKALLGKNRITRPNEKVLIYHTTGHASTALLHFIRTGLDLKTPKKLKFEPIVFFIESNFKLRSDQRESILKRVDDEVNKFNFPIFYVSLAQYIINPSQLSSIVSDKYEGVVLGDYDHFTVSGTNKVDLTTRTQVNKIFEQRLLIEVAKFLKCKCIFTPDLAIDTASQLLTNVCLGRGEHIVFDTGTVDSRDEEVTILRPLRNFTIKEAALYNYFHNLDPVNFVHQQANPYASIQNLMQKFVTDLQENYPSTISTIVRTGDKLGINKYTSNAKCLFCQAPLGVSGESLGSSEATNFSHWVSTQTPNCNISVNDRTKYILNTFNNRKYDEYCFSCNEIQSFLCKQ